MSPHMLGVREALSAGVAGLGGRLKRKGHIQLLLSQFSNI